MNLVAWTRRYGTQPLQTKAVPQSGSLSLTYKLVRPSTVTAVTVGPSGDVVQVDAANTQRIVEALIRAGPKPIE